MTDHQWQQLKEKIQGVPGPALAGFIIDSPWLPGWYGISILDYFSQDELWFEANLKAIKTFPEALFLPGFWSEFGMCTEPSAFGARCSFPENEFPHAFPILRNNTDIDELSIPNPKTDGLLPFVLKRLKHYHPRIQAEGHEIKFAVARGPLNIASYLMGMTEFLTLMMLEPDKAHLLLQKISRFLQQWIELQMESFPSIDGIFLLDDVIGFMGEDEFKTFGLPYFKELYLPEVSVKFLHNDAPCDASIRFLPEMGVNLFNMAFDTDLNELKMRTHQSVCMLGNIPPRDVLAQGSKEEIRASVLSLKQRLENPERVILSCGGGMPPGVSSGQILSFINAVNEI